MGDVIIDGGTGANRLVVLDANGKIPALDGSAVTNVAGANFSTGTIPTARLDTGTTAGKIVKLDGNAKLPAVSGAALTGVVGASKNSSDPAIDTNPSGGVGTEWQNTTSGEVYICTDATAGENVWKNVGAGTGDIEPFHFTNASLYCFFPAGNAISDSNRATIDKNAFASDADSTDQGDVTVSRRGVCCASSTTHGYTVGGYTGSPMFVDIIDKFAMASTADATDVGDMPTTGQTAAGVTSATHGYVVGGTWPSAANRYVQQYAFASDGAGTNLGDLLSVGRDYPVGGSSSTHGYTMGSYSGSPTTQIEKFAFADNATTADVGNLVTSNSNSASHCEAGYVWTSGQFGGGSNNNIDKMSTASDSDSVASGSNLSVAAGGGPAAGNASSTYGYCMGGGVNNPHADVVDKWPFASSSTATDVGNLREGKEGIMANGCQL